MFYPDCYTTEERDFDPPKHLLIEPEQKCGKKKGWTRKSNVPCSSRPHRQPFCSAAFDSAHLISNRLQAFVDNPPLTCHPHFSFLVLQSRTCIWSCAQTLSGLIQRMRGTPTIPSYSRRPSSALPIRSWFVCKGTTVRRLCVGQGRYLLRIHLTRLGCESLSLKS